jgi:hypothetical protein
MRDETVYTIQQLSNQIQQLENAVGMLSLIIISKGWSEEGMEKLLEVVNKQREDDICEKNYRDFLVEANIIREAAEIK